MRLSRALAQFRLRTPRECTSPFSSAAIEVAVAFVRAAWTGSRMRAQQGGRGPSNGERHRGKWNASSMDPAHTSAPHRTLEHSTWAHLPRSVTACGRRTAIASDGHRHHVSHDCPAGVLPLASRSHVCAGPNCFSSAASNPSPAGQRRSTTEEKRRPRWAF